MLAFILLPVLLALGATQSGTPAGWVEYSPGTCNVLISAPHGGALQVDEIAARTDGCLAEDGTTCRWQKGCSPAAAACRASDAKDSYTQEVAALIVKHLSEKYNCVPHFVRSNLHRSRMDPNREIEESAQGDQLAQAAWRTYHEHYMAAAMETIRSASNGKGLVFDFHGQSHSEQWTEIGYLLSKYELNSGSADLTKSSIRSLAARVGPASPSDLISGPQSFGGFLEASGQKVVPGPSNPSPGNGNYYNGGYITRRYGSRDSGSIDAIQVEIASGIRFDLARREAFAVDVAKAIDDYRTAHGYKLLFS